jgi:hypothetical protein
VSAAGIYPAGPDKASARDQGRDRRAPRTSFRDRRGDADDRAAGFLPATVRRLVEKAEAGYAKVQTDLVQMRRAGRLPYDWLADNTRWQRKPRTFTSVEAALNETARFYRKALWADADAYTEVWLEKDALSGVVLPITAQYDVPLMVARGYASLSFLHTAAEHIGALDVPAYVYHLGDFDPSGVNAGEKIEETLREMAPTAEIHFERIAVTPPQVAAWDLPSRPTKASDRRPRASAKCRSSLTRSSSTSSGRYCETPLNNISRPGNSRFSRPLRRANAH